MRILLTNDDGIHSEGLQLLAKTLSVKHEVYVVAPSSEMSATSHHIHFHTPLYLQKHNVDGAGVAYSVQGTPADCVTLAIKQLNIAVDLVVSGPNRGANVALDTIYSGTVAAAEEGAICHVKAIALSSDSKHEPHFETACNYLANNLESLLGFILPDTVLNVNVPAVSPEQIAGVVACSQGNRRYNDYYEQHNVDGLIGYSLEGKPCETHPDDNYTDTYFLKNKYITITPLQLDRTNYSLLASIKEKLK